MLHISSCSLREALACLSSSVQRRNALEAAALALGHIDSSLEQFVAFCERSPHALLQNLPVTHKAGMLIGSFTKLTELRSVAFEHLGHEHAGRTAVVHMSTGQTPDARRTAVVHMSTRQMPDARRTAVVHTVWSS